MADNLGLSSSKTLRVSKEYEEQRQVTRKRNILVLIWEYLQEMGYVGAVNALECEVNLDLHQFRVCDNVDLDTILQEYEAYYQIKFQKYPQIVKKIAKNEKIEEKTWKNKAFNKMAGGDKIIQRRRINSCMPNFQSSTDVSKEVTGDKLNLSLNGQQLNANKKQEEKTVSEPEIQLLKPLGLFSNYNNEWKELATAISKDIYQKNPNVKWSDIIGLDDAKRLIKEAVVYPIKYPQLFTGILSPWKGFLLFGPPGTGKTLLAKALATECKTTFFNISASSIVSKWRGDSEKLVRVLFELARFHAPSTIFIDEMDSVMTQRDFSGGHGEHEGSRRMKTELLIQMDGISKSDEMVFFLAASNLPWELDHALLRRLEKRIFVDLPNESARSSMFEFYLPQSIPIADFKLTCQLDYSHLARLSVGYSGCDIMLVCKEAAMTRVRHLVRSLDRGETVKSLEILQTSDVESALNKTKPSSSQFVDKYDSWNSHFGSV